MGGLGNGRRAGRSPPLLIGALVACILVLGFNYWVSSSRNLELQTKLYELDGKVRRGAAEQEVAEMKRSQFQEEIQRQKEQLGHIESLYKRQLEGAQNTCSQEKVVLQQNVSSSSKAIRELKGQLNRLTDDLGKLQRELQNCHGNINTLNNKLTYDMTHCNSQVLAQKELCDERVAAAKIEIQKKMEKLILSSSVQENAAKEPVEEEEAAAPEIARANTVKVATTEKQIPEVAHQKESPEAPANELVDKDPDAPVDLDAAKEHPQIETHSVATATAQKQEILPAPEEDGEKDEDDIDNNDTGNDIDNDNADGNDTDDNNDGEDEKMHLMKNAPVMELMDDHKEETDDNGVHGMLHAVLKEDQKPVEHKLDEPDDYDADDRIVAGANPVKPQGQNTDKGREQEPANYNGDDENEGEFEADKQAELARL